MRGVQNLEGGGGRKWRFRQGVITPREVLALRVTGIVSFPLNDPSTQRFMNGPSPAGTRSAPQARTIPRATQHLLTPRGKIKNGRALKHGFVERSTSGLSDQQMDPDGAPSCSARSEHLFALRKHAPNSRH